MCLGLALDVNHSLEYEQIPLLMNHQTKYHLLTLFTKPVTSVNCKDTNLTRSLPTRSINSLGSIFTSLPVEKILNPSNYKVVFLFLCEGTDKYYTICCANLRHSSISLMMCQELYLLSIHIINPYYYDLLTIIFISTFFNYKPILKNPLVITGRIILAG